MSVSAYKRTILNTESPRDIERKIFSRITANLQTHAESFDASETPQARLAFLSGSLQPALIENIKLWSALKADLSHPDNALDADLRAQLISMALFVERHTSSILRGVGKIQTLVDINHSIINGLAGISVEAA